MVSAVIHHCRSAALSEHMAVTLSYVTLVFLYTAFGGGVVHLGALTTNHSETEKRRGSDTLMHCCEVSVIPSEATEERRNSDTLMHCCEVSVLPSEAVHKTGTLS